MYMFLDTETTSALDDAEIIQMAFILEKDGKFTTVEQFASPDKQQIDPSSMAVHNITPEMLEEYPILEKTLGYAKLQASINRFSPIIVAHNAPFDVNKLRAAGIDFGDEPKIIDTLKVAKFINDQNGLPWKELKLGYLKYYYRLDKYKASFTEMLGIDPAKGAHDAMSDIIDLIILFKFLQREFGATAEEMIELSNMNLFLKHMPFGKNRGELIENLTYNQLQWNAAHHFDSDVRFTCAKYL